MQAILKIAQVHRVEVGRPEAFDRPRTREEALQRLEESAGPEARKLLEGFLKKTANHLGWRSGVPREPDPDRWLIVKDVNRNTCTVSATKPTNNDFVILTSLKAVVVGGKAVNDLMVAECGCEHSCRFELPHRSFH